MASYALVLFDVDGCTAIVDSKKLVLEGKDLVNGQQGYMKFGREKLKVEILQLSDSKRELNKFEDEWSTSHQSIALDKEKKRRKNRPDGYLAVWPEDMDDVVPAAEELPDPNVEEPDQNEDQINDGLTEELVTAKPTKKTKETTEKTKESKEKTGSKGRKITVLYEGSGDYSMDIAIPKRVPYFLEELSADERDLVNLQVEQYKRGLESATTQTETVVILGPEDILPPQTSEAFHGILKLLRELKKGQQEIKGQVQDLTREVVALKEKHSGRNSVGSMLTTNELHELLVNSENDTSVETAQGLEESLFTTKQPRVNKDKESDVITVHLGITSSDEQTLPTLTRPKRTTASPLTTTSPSTSATTTSSLTSSTTANPPISSITTSLSTSATTTSSLTSSTTASQPVSSTTASPSTSATTTSSLTSSTTASPPISSTTASPSTSATTTMLPINTNTAIVPINSFTTCLADTTITTIVPVNSFSSILPSSPPASTLSDSFNNPESPYKLPAIPNNMIMPFNLNLAPTTSNIQTVFSLSSISNYTSPVTPVTANSDTALATINMCQAASIMPTSALPGNSPSPSTNKKAIQFKCFTGPIIEIDGPQDIAGTPEDAEFRIRQKTSLAAATSACSKGNFGWILTQSIYTKEELVGRNVFGNRKNIAAISPRRRHAIEHAVAEVYGCYDVYLKEVVTGINTGLRRLRSRIPFSAIENV